MTDYRDVNRANWDERAQAHAASADYNLAAFADDPRHLSGVVRFDRPLLGDVAGLRGVHLQCHIGSDTVSLARLGATMTGVDFSPRSLEQARLLSERSGTPVEFVESDVYGAVDALGPERFDLVYTGIGALCWLPDIRRWAQTVAALLVPGGRLSDVVGGRRLFLTGLAGFTGGSLLCAVAPSVPLLVAAACCRRAVARCSCPPRSCSSWRPIRPSSG
jgi:SAM-dependent methyltransferase